GLPALWAQSRRLSHDQRFFACGQYAAGFPVSTRSNRQVVGKRNGRGFIRPASSARRVSSLGIRA
ncbi:MAG: hypothetical protein V1754_09860, partial [Pseudomonadota bacterium]